jgi:hypothetical protein
MRLFNIFKALSFKEGSLNINIANKFLITTGLCKGSRYLRTLIVATELYYSMTLSSLLIKDSLYLYLIDSS